MRFASLVSSIAVSLFIFNGQAKAQSAEAAKIPNASEIEAATTVQGLDPLNNSSEIQPRIVIGEENRTRFSDASSPWRSFGKIKFGKDTRWMCSGTLVGPRHVLTNSHCVDLAYPIHFYPSYHNGNFLTGNQRSSWVTWIYRGTASTDTSSGQSKPVGTYAKESDWAILVLNDALGSEFGWLGTKSWNSGWLNSTWFNVQYPNAGALNENGEYPLFQKGCKIRENTGGYFYHDCDSNGGASGSSLVGTWEGSHYVVALHNMSWGTNGCTPYKVGTCSNGAVMPDKFIETLKKALKERP